MIKTGKGYFVNFQLVKNTAEESVYVITQYTENLSITDTPGSQTCFIIYIYIYIYIHTVSNTVCL
jgi:hypothetical protein